ncbi:hypothetical protein GRI89_00295 [Altererythrobacter salegens]|uniref:Sugar transporter n=1 Tax=Croceibacterium salegens TaxID=1737568 RepID=A0A6I4SSP5_9SPHN|nr:hypothetical protein [Croceibacterium salegens]MXO57986.1 hypothetical protein [Croceibacterium salegens]
MTTLAEGKAPVHLWVVGVLSLLWNGFGCYDYLMTELRNEAYMAQVPPQALAIFDAFPVWAIALWAIGVWLSMLGVILLLLRNRQATTAFLIAVVAVLASFFYQATTDLPQAMGGASYWIMPAVIIAVTIGQWMYANRMAAAGVLR